MLQQLRRILTLSQKGVENGEMRIGQNFTTSVSYYCVRTYVAASLSPLELRTYVCPTSVFARSAPIFAVWPGPGFPPVCDAAFGPWGQCIVQLVEVYHKAIGQMPVHKDRQPDALAVEWEQADLQFPVLIHLVVVD